MARDSFGSALLPAESRQERTGFTLSDAFPDYSIPAQFELEESPPFEVPASEVESLEAGSLDSPPHQGLSSDPIGSQPPDPSRTLSESPASESTASADGATASSALARGLPGGVARAGGDPRRGSNFDPYSDDDDDEPATLGSVLSRDELRELLSPLSKSTGGFRSHESSRTLDESEALVSNSDLPIPQSGSIARRSGAGPMNSGGSWSNRARPCPPVLLLTADPEDVAQLSDGLSGFDVTLVPTSHRFAAIDLLGRSPFSAVFAGDRALGVEGQSFIDRLRQIDATVPLALLIEPGVELDALGVHNADSVKILRRPLIEREIREFFEGSSEASSGAATAVEPLAVDSPRSGALATTVEDPLEVKDHSELVDPSEDAESDRVEESGELRQRTGYLQPINRDRSDLPASSEIHDPVDAEGTSASRPRVSMGIRCWLESRPSSDRSSPDRSSPERFVESLRRWSQEDPAMGGVVVLKQHDQGSSFELKILADMRTERDRIWSRGARDLGEAVFDRSETVTSLGVFLVFSDDRDRNSRWAIEVAHPDRPTATSLAAELATEISVVAP